MSQDHLYFTIKILLSHLKLLTNSLKSFFLNHFPIDHYAGYISREKATFVKIYRGILFSSELPKVIKTMDKIVKRALIPFSFT